MKFDNPKNTVYITVEQHLSERWMSGFANCPIRFGITGKYFVNSAQITCFEITGYRIELSTVSWLLEH